MGRNAKEVRGTRFEKRGTYCHIETEGCIVNIYPCLVKEDGRKATTIEVLPNRSTDDQYAFDIGQTMTRVVSVRE